MDTRTCRTCGQALVAGEPGGDTPCDDCCEQIGFARDRAAAWAAAEQRAPLGEALVACFVNWD